MLRARNFLVWFLWRSGISTLARAFFARSGRFVLEFHGVASQRYKELPHEVQPSLTIYELRLVLFWLKDHFSFLTPSEFFASNKAGVLLTFDDGLENNYTNALPVLNELRAPAIFFVSTQHVINPKEWLPAAKTLMTISRKSGQEVSKGIAEEFFNGMSREQLLTCAGNPLITIGSHTVSHPFLTRCNERELEFELTSSKELLEEITEQRINIIAYPTGDYNQKVVSSVRRAGYIAAFAENSLGLGEPLFEIPRIGIYSAKAPYLSVKLSGLHRKPIKGQLIPDDDFL